MFAVLARAFRGTMKSLQSEIPNLRVRVPRNRHLGEFTSEELAAANPLVQKALSLDNATPSQIKKARVAQAIQKFQRFEGDTGSPEVQIACMTERILAMYVHLQTAGRNDVTAKLKINEKVAQRKKMLKYLQRKDFHMYRHVCAALGIPELESVQHKEYAVFTSHRAKRWTN